MKKLLTLLFVLICTVAFGQNVHILNSDLGGAGYIHRFPLIRQYYPAQGLIATGTTVPNYPIGSLDSTNEYFTTTNYYPLGGTKYGGVLWNAALGDSALVTSPFGLLIGSSFSASHSSPWHHWSRLEPGGISTFQYNYIDSVGTMAYYMRQLTNYRWYPQAIGGQTTAQMRSRWARDVLGEVVSATDNRSNQTITRKPYIIFFDGIGNDPYQLNMTPAVTEANLIYFASSCQDNNIRFVCAISTSTAGASVAADVYVKTVNKWLESGALDKYGVALFDLNHFWSDPAWGYDGIHGNPNYVNQTDFTHFTSGQGGASAGYDSLAIAMVTSCKVPILTKIVISSNIGPTAPIANFSYVSALTIDGQPYTFVKAQDTEAITVPLGSEPGYDSGDSVWLKATGITSVVGSGNTYGYGYIAWYMDNTNGGKDTSYYTQRTMGSSGATGTYLDISHLTITPENTAANDTVLYVKSVSGNYGLLVIPTGSATYMVLNGNAIGAKLNSAYFSIYGTGVNISGQGSINFAGATNQLGSLLLGNTSNASATGDGIGLFSGGMQFQFQSNSIIAGNLFNYTTYTPLNLATSSSNVNYSIISTNHTFGNSNGLNDSLGGLTINETLNDTLTFGVSGMFQGFHLRYTPTSLGVMKLGGFWNDYGFNWLNSLGGSTGIGTTSIHGSAKLDITDTVRGFLPPRLSAAQIANIGYIKSVTINSGGTGYTAPKAVFSGGNGSGVRAFIGTTGAVITSVTIIDPGINYGGSSPTLSIVNGAGSGASFTVNVSGPDSGLVVFNTTTSALQVYTGSQWVSLSPAITTVSTSSATSLTLAASSFAWAFTGSSATTWTLPAVSGNTGMRFILKNRGSAAITLVPAGSDNLYTTSTVTTLTLNAGDSFEVINDGTYWLIL